MFSVECVDMFQAAPSFYPTSGRGAKPAHGGAIEDRAATELTYLQLQSIEKGGGKGLNNKISGDLYMAPEANSSNIHLNSLFVSFTYF